MQLPYLPGDTGKSPFTADAVKSLKTSCDVEVACRSPSPPIPAKKIQLYVERKKLEAAIQTKKSERYIQMEKVQAENENPFQIKWIQSLKTTPEKNSVCDSSTMQPSASKARKLLQTDKCDNKQIAALDVTQCLQHAEQQKFNAQPKTSAILVTPAEQMTVITSLSKIVSNAIVLKSSLTTTSIRPSARSTFTFDPVAETPETSPNKQVTKSASHHPNTSLCSSSVSSSFIKPTVSTLKRTLKRSSSVHQARIKMLSRCSPCRSVHNLYPPSSHLPFRDLHNLRKNHSLAEETGDDKSSFSDVKILFCMKQFDALREKTQNLCDVESLSQEVLQD